METCTGGKGKRGGRHSHAAGASSGAESDGQTRWVATDGTGGGGDNARLNKGVAG